MKFVKSVGLGIMLADLFLLGLISSKLLVGQVTSTTTFLFVVAFGVGLGTYLFSSALED